MPVITITKTYQDANILTEADLDSAFDSVSSFLNTTKIDSDNIQTGGIATANLAASAVTTAKIASGNITTALLDTSTQQALVPTGCVLEFGGSAAPTGWLLCDGTAVSRSTYATLFGVIGTTYGTGNGTTTFNLPDHRGRTGIGAGTGSGLTARTLGANVGVETVNLAHTHGGLTHNHQVTNAVEGGAAMNGYDAGGTEGALGVVHITGAGGGATLLANTGAQTTVGSLYTNNALSNTDSQLSSSQTVMQPSLVMNYIIKT